MDSLVISHRSKSKYLAPLISIDYSIDQVDAFTYWKPKRLERYAGLSLKITASFFRNTAGALTDLALCANQCRKGPPSRYALLKMTDNTNRFLDTLKGISTVHLSST